MRLTRRRPGWESEDQVQVRSTRWKRLSQSWLSRSRLSTVAPSLSADPPTPRQPRGRDGAYTAATGARSTPPRASSFDPYRAGTVAELIEAWLPLTFALNSLGGCLGLLDLYPFILSPAVITKLAFVHAQRPT